MYESFFQFRERPFVSTPCPQRYFPAACIEHARQTLIRCVECALGPGIVIGPAGTGKSLLCQSLAEHFRASFSVVTLANAKICSQRALLQSLLFELDLPYRDLEEGELRLSLMDYLEPNGECHPNGLLLIVDEAHTLSLRPLEEIRMITNLVRNGQPRVRLILAGGMSLEERFASPKLESFNQRLAARCYLQPLTREETANYVRSQIAAVGGDADQLFEDAALRAIFTATDGIPRLINQVCDYALLLASVGNHPRLNAAGIEEAWADLQQLPLPFAASETGAAPAATSIIEFGQLDDELAAPSFPVTPVTRQDGLHDTFVSASSTNTSAQLDHIERGVATVLAIEDPAGPIVEFGSPAFTAPPASTDPLCMTPQSELAQATVRAPENPFGEAFEEEEFVLDHYASLETIVLRNRPHVTSVEGRALAAALCSVEQSALPPSLAIAEQTRADELTADERAALGGESPCPEPAVPHRSEVADFDPANDPVLPELAWDFAAEPPTAIPITPSAAEDDGLHSFVTVVATTPQDFDWAAAAPPHVEPQRMRVVPADDRDLLIVERDDPSPHIPLQPRPQIRRQEYRQLFAKLRRG